MKKLVLILITFMVLFVRCTKDAPSYPVVVQPATIAPVPFVITDNIYPNPCHGTFTIQTNSTDSQTVVMYNLMGQEKLNLIINGTTAIVDNTLTQGVYMVVITNHTGVVKKKLIVE